MMRLLWCALLAAIAALPARSAERFVEVEDRDEVGTVAGPLRLAESTEEEGMFELLLAGEAIAENPGFAAGIARVYPDAEHARLVLVEFDTGGSGCPLTYRLVEVAPGGPARVTEEFGNCNALKGITREGDAWLFHLAGNATPIETWSYRVGVLAKVKARPGREHRTQR